MADKAQTWVWPPRDYVAESEVLDRRTRRRYRNGRFPGVPWRRLRMPSGCPAHARSLKWHGRGRVRPVAAGRHGC